MSLLPEDGIFLGGDGFLRRRESSAGCSTVFHNVSASGISRVLNVSNFLHKRNMTCAPLEEPASRLNERQDQNVGKHETGDGSYTLRKGPSRFVKEDPRSIRQYRFDDLIDLSISIGNA